MSNVPSIYEPRTMGKVITRMPQTNTFLRDTFFKHVETFATKSVDVDFKKGSRKIAPYVHRKIGGKTIPNSGYQTKSYTPPLLAPNKVTTIDSLLTRMAGENPYSGKTPAERAVAKMAQDFSELNEMIVRRVELMCAQAIFNGKIEVVGEGVNEEIDFGFSNKETISTATKKWSNAASNPLADLKRWHKQVQKTGFVNCNICIMSDDVADAFINHEKIQKLLDTKNYNLAVINPKQLPNGVTYVGTINELGLDIYTYNEWYLDDWTDAEKPTEKPLVPQGTLALLSTNANYSVNYGAITLLDERTGQFNTVEGQVVPDTWVERNPSRRFLQLNSSPLPIPHEVDSLSLIHI